MAAPNAMKLTRTHRILVGVVIAGAIVIAAIGFAGSYAAVRDLAEKKGFGAFALVFPIGIDAGIVVLLALDLLLTWIRIPFPLLRQTAWLLTAATIAFNGAAAWPDPLGVGMHAVIPVLFVVSVEAARHAIGRIADITADRHMESVRIARWLLAFPSTFRLWRRMKLWELRSYDEVIRLEQDRLVYRARLRARYGRAWRRKAPVESLMPLRLARYGVPISQTGAAGLAAAGIKPPVIAPGAAAQGTPQLPAATAPPPQEAFSAAEPEHSTPPRQAETATTSRPHPTEDPRSTPPAQGYETAAYGNAPQGNPPYESGAYANDSQDPAYEPVAYAPAPGDPAYGGHTPPETVSDVSAEDPSQVTVPVSPGRRRSLGQAQPNGHAAAFVPSPRPTEPEYQPERYEEPAREEYAAPAPPPPPAPEPEPIAEDDPVGIPDGVLRDDLYFQAYRQFASEQASFPSARQLSRTLNDRYGVANSDGTLLSEAYLRTYLREFRDRYNTEMGIAG
ncbi:DUF2637 domain-containing protein [Streptomyces pathocidini]|uniref:DUF2637 domain-containing protein n=1 Tax=Streptomyces pathocidini TaxID=1650571 RepID=UPI0033F77E07